MESPHYNDLVTLLIKAHQLHQNIICIESGETDVRHAIGTIDAIFDSNKNFFIKVENHQFLIEKEDYITLDERKGKQVAILSCLDSNWTLSIIF